LGQHFALRLADSATPLNRTAMAHRVLVWVGLTSISPCLWDWRRRRRPPGGREDVDAWSRGGRYGPRPDSAPGAGRRPSGGPVIPGFVVEAAGAVAFASGNPFLSLARRATFHGAAQVTPNDQANAL